MNLWMVLPRPDPCAADVPAVIVAICWLPLQIKIIDFGAACDLVTGINFNPLYGMLDPRYSPPEELVMPQSKHINPNFSRLLSTGFDVHLFAGCLSASQLQTLVMVCYSVLQALHSAPMLLPLPSPI